MNKKVIISIVAVIVIAVVVAVAAIVIKNNKGDKKDKNVELNLQELSTTISEKKPFDEMPTMEVDTTLLESVFEINADEYEEVVGKVPMMNVQASMYLIIKAKDGSVDSVKQKVEAYAQKQEEIWSTYLPEQYDLVKQRKFNVIGDYVYLIIAENAAEMEKLINK